MNMVSSPGLLMLLETAPPHAMILAAGLGTRMRPLTLTTPKPLIRVQSITLLDAMLQKLHAAGVKDGVVNMHYLGEQIADHVAQGSAFPLHVQDERDELLDSGGGVKRALPQLGSLFWVANADTLWAENTNNLERLWQSFDEDSMDCCLLVAHRDRSLGYEGAGDLMLNPDGTVRWRAPHEQTPYVFAGVSLIKASLFEGVMEARFSLKMIFDRAHARGRLHGVLLDGFWMHVGTPEALREAEDYLRQQSL